MLNLIEAIKRDVEEQKKETMENLKNEHGYTLNYYLTDLRKNQLADGVITRDKAVEIASKKVEKEYNKKLEKTIDKVNEIANAEKFDGCTITIDWRKGSMGANQAKAELRGCGYIEGSRTGGCGYDKESTAMADVLNECYPLMKLLYKYRAEHLDGTNHNTFGYGSGYNKVLPYFEGGVGVSSFYRIFETIGCTLKHVACGKTFDVYEVVVNE